MTGMCTWLDIESLIGWSLVIWFRTVQCELRDHSSEGGPMMHVIHRHRSRSSVIHAKLYFIRMDNNDMLMDTSVCGVFFSQAIFFLQNDH
jgi:hypothetical protein